MNQLITENNPMITNENVAIHLDMDISRDFA